MTESFAPEQLDAFRQDGFLIVEEGLVSEQALERLRDRYVRVFDGEYETGIRPVPVVVRAGGGSLRRGLTWHGSAPNTTASVARMALASHMIPVETPFHETNADVTYSRYRRRGDFSLGESFLPVK